MTDTSGDRPFPGFPGFPPAEMLDKMWDMMRLTPFGAAFPGMRPGTAQGFASPLGAMSDMMTPLMSVEELDKRITDMRAVEQWLKLNLNMLQSAIQALEVQRATLATLHAFGAFAQASMTQPEAGQQQSTDSPSWRTAAGAQAGDAPSPGGAAPGPGADAGKAPQGAQADGAGPQGAFDPSVWWNLLQSQFNQLASFAVSQPGAAPGESSPASNDSTAQDAAAKTAGATSAAKRAAPRKPAGKSGGGRAPGGSGGSNGSDGK